MNHALRLRLADLVTSTDALWFVVTVLVGTAYAGGGA